jgi:hypothetical protein
LTDLAELIARVEGATEGSRELGVDILRALDPMYGKARRSAAMEAMLFSKENPTDSIDAALSLVERKLPGWSVRLFVHPDAAYADLYRLGELLHFPLGQVERRITAGSHEGIFVQQRLPALAIILALLRSLQAGAQN